MKKTIKALLLAIVIGLIVISLTGCGSDKIVATKTIEDESVGNYDSKITVEFKSDKLETVEMEMTFEKEEVAQGMYGILNMGMSMAEEEETEGIEIEQKGNKIIMKMDSKAFASSEGITDEDMTKEAIKKSLEDDGYKIK